mmetsp:Transcript_21687/g.84528  ORF Transcript_21687/g.84528 Transcript_21687/m.84528 type:complete len:417 (-) Transcript_21687:1508-2758(-)
MDLGGALEQVAGAGRAPADLAGQAKRGPARGPGDMGPRGGGLGPHRGSLHVRPCGQQGGRVGQGAEADEARLGQRRQRVAVGLVAVGRRLAAQQVELQSRQASGIAQRRHAGRGLSHQRLGTGLVDRGAAAGADAGLDQVEQLVLHEQGFLGEPEAVAQADQLGLQVQRGACQAELGGFAVQRGALGVIAGRLRVGRRAAPQVDLPARGGIDAVAAEVVELAEVVGRALAAGVGADPHRGQALGAGRLGQGLGLPEAGGGGAQVAVVGEHLVDDALQLGAVGKGGRHLRRAGAGGRRLGEGLGRQVLRARRQRGAGAAGEDAQGEQRECRPLHVRLPCWACRRHRCRGGRRGPPPRPGRAARRRGRGASRCPCATGCRTPASGRCRRRSRQACRRTRRYPSHAASRCRHRCRGSAG